MQVRSSIALGLLVAMRQPLVTLMLNSLIKTDIDTVLRRRCRYDNDTAFGLRAGY